MTPHTWPSWRRRSIGALATLTLAAVGLSCADSEPTSQPTTTLSPPETTLAPIVDLPDVVVTTSVLGAVVSDLVDGVADVVVIIPDGQDPHDFAPSARDLERLNDAAFIVANGLNLEVGLDAILRQVAERDGTVFFVGEHITVRTMNESDDDHDHAHADDDTDDHADDHSHDHDGIDPHLWLSPAAMLEMLPDLAEALATTFDVSLDDAATRVSSSLTTLDRRIAGAVSALPACTLVTGHDELGYFADRYGCTIIGAVLPSLSTTAEASAKQLVALKKVIAEHRVAVIFTSLGTPQAVAEQIARETGTTVVELSTHVMRDAVSYAEFMLALTERIVDALS